MPLTNDSLSSLLQHGVSTVEPPDYVVPSFPSLYWPIPVAGPQAYFLYHAYDVWRFTTIWHLVFFGAVHIATSGYAVVIQWKSWKVIWIVPLVYVLMGGIEAVAAGGVVGGL